MGLTTYGNYNIEDTADFVTYIPKTDPHFATSLAVIPLQLMGYYVSVAKGLDVDKPRNLAKSVSKGKKACLSQCRAKKLWMGNIAISHIRSIPVQEKRFRIRYWIGIRNLWKQIRKNLGKCKKRKIRAAAVSWINDEVAAVFKKREKLRKNGIPVKMVKY